MEMDQYLKVLGELYLQHRLSYIDAEQKLSQKDALIEHLKAENMRLKGASNNGNSGNGTVGT